MKYFFLLCCFMLTIKLASAQTTDTLTKKIDLRFLGSWSGHDKGTQQKGTDIYWVQHRTEDGGFIMLYNTIDEKGNVNSYVEKGKWWVMNGIFYELHFASGNTDTYTFNVLDEKHIKFKLKSTEVNFDKPDYEFIDTKVDVGE